MLGRVTKGTRKLWCDGHVHCLDFSDGHPLVTVYTYVRVYEIIHSKYVQIE